MLEITALTRRYATRTAVDNVSLTLRDGEVCALLGPNGSGKTTLMKMIVGLTKPTSGTILLDGEPVNAAARAKIAYMPTESCFYSYMTIADAGRWYDDFYPDFSRKRFDEALARMELNPRDLIRKLSSGMNAKVRLALTLSRDARLMMFDEPLNGVDILTRAQVAQELINCRAEGRIMLVSTHLVEELEDQFDSAVFMHNGAVALAGSRDKLAEQGTLTELYLKIYGTEGIVNA